MTPNALIGKTEKPSSAEITKALGPVLKFESGWWIGWPGNKASLARGGNAFRQNAAGPFV